MTRREKEIVKRLEEHRRVLATLGPENVIKFRECLNFFDNIIEREFVGESFSIGYYLVEFRKNGNSTDFIEYISDFIERVRNREVTLR